MLDLWGYGLNMKIESQLKIQILITDRRNYFPRLLAMEIENANVADVDAPTDTFEHMRGLELIITERNALESLTNSLFESVIEGTAFSNHIPEGDEETYDALYDYYLNLIFNSMETNKLDYEKLCNVQLYKCGSTSYIGLIFNVNSIKGIQYEP